MSKSTKYEIVRNGHVIDTRSDKTAAIKLANKPGDLVRTTAGTEVFSVPARRVMKADRFKPFTRVDERIERVELAPGVKLPKHYAVAYVRPRQGFAMVRHTDDLTYLLIDLATGAQTPVSTCREAAQVVKDLAKAKAKTSKKGHLTAVA